MADAEQIERNIYRLRRLLPDGVELLAAVKGRTPAEIRAALAGGLRRLGHNYVQEAAASIAEVGRDAARWHLIGHLQRNKVNRAVELFDQIDSLDSERLALELERACAARGKVMPVLLEINSAGETSKSGVSPAAAETLARQMAECSHLRLEGLMTMGPADGDEEALRRAFRLTRELLERLRATGLVPAAGAQLSMGMSGSWRLAVEEGATIVRVGTAIFGPRPP